MAEPITAAGAAAATAPSWGPPLASAAGTVLSTAFNAFMADKQTDFQRDMANTAHQREVKDLRAAGLNPILSAKHGGASVPAGASAQAAQDRTPETMLQSRLQAGQLALLDAQTRDANSAAALKDVQAGDVTATQAQRINSLIADVYAKLQSGNLSGAQREQALQQIQNLEAQKELVIKQTAHSAATLEKEQVKGQLWSIPNEALKKVPGYWERFKNWTKKINKRQRGASGRW